MIYTAHYKSPVGDIMLAESEGSIIGAWIEGQKYFLATVKESMEERETPALIYANAWLDRYFSGRTPRPGELKLSPRGGEFRQTVWRLLLEIPYGEVVTYGEIAKKTAAILGREKMSAQAVGGAVGHNPISIIIPCHRVVGANGNLTGYGGGMDKKIKLLAHEGVDMTRFFVPKG